MSEKKKPETALKTKKLIRILIVVAALTAAAVGYHIYSSSSSDRIVIELDAGHGGDQTGYAGIVNESEFNQNVVTELQKLLQKDSHFTVLLSHEENTAASVQEKAEKINKDHPDAVISIHAGYSRDTSKSGMNIYADVPTAETHDKSLKMAQSIQSAFSDSGLNPAISYYYYKEIRTDVFQAHIVDASDTADYGEETLNILKDTDVPAVEIEQIYVSSQSDTDAWANEDGYKEAARRYYKAIKDCFGVQ